MMFSVRRGSLFLGHAAVGLGLSWQPIQFAACWPHAMAEAAVIRFGGEIVPAPKWDDAAKGWTVDEVIADALGGEVLS